MLPASFAEIPGVVRERVRGGERVLLVVLDGFGAEFVARHGEHRLVERLRLTPLRSQFPSTTTAQMTTVYSGQPVEQHGLYEWNILEPSLGQIICPLRYALAESREEGSLAGRLAPSTLLPGPTFYESLDERSLVLLPSAIAGSCYSRIATRGASVGAFDDLAVAAREGLRGLAESDCAHVLLYWDQIDAIGHEHGPSPAAFAAACTAALDDLWEGLRGMPAGVTVLITADHGQVDVEPAKVDYLDDLWPQLTQHLTQLRPAGSSRDTFLHVKPASSKIVIEELASRLGDYARVLPADELFPNRGPRLADRLGNVAILPAAGRQTWMRRAAANERWFRGQHGGQHPAETSVYLAELQT